MTADWHTFMRIYDRCISSGVLLDDDLDYATAATRILQPESLALLLLRRMERHMTDLVKWTGDDA